MTIDVVWQGTVWLGMVSCSMAWNGHRQLPFIIIKWRYIMNYSESTIRRRAYSIGYRAEKGFQHFGQFVCHDSCGDRFTGYMVKG